MNRLLTISVAFLAIVLISGAVFAGWYYQNAKFKTTDKNLTTEIGSTTAEVDAIKATKDKNNYSPTDIVKNFMNEFKLESMEKTKLYLTKSQQGLDLKKALKIQNDLEKITIVTVTDQTENETSTVILKGFIDVETNSFEKTFHLIKEADLWKINQID